MAGALERAAAKSPGERRPPSLADNRSEKKNYAQNLSAELALMVAACLRPHYSKARLTPREDGTGLEFSVGAKLDSKKTDVGVWDDAAGLILGVSIKTYSFRDYHGPKDGRPAHLGRYQRNVKRNDMELRDEADVLHRRQPYAVLFAVFFMPRDACWDGLNGHSSFAHAVFTFRKRAGRASADAIRSDLFEKVYIGLSPMTAPLSSSTLRTRRRGTSLRRTPSHSPNSWRSCGARWSSGTRALRPRIGMHPTI